jgi:hypothetical protein
MRALLTLPHEQCRDKDPVVERIPAFLSKHSYISTTLEFLKNKIEQNYASHPGSADAVLNRNI